MRGTFSVRFANVCCRLQRVRRPLASWEMRFSFCSDGDGFISVDEMRRALRTQCPSASASEAQRLLQQLDANGDGLLSYEEFVKELGRTRCPVGCCTLGCLCS